MINYTETLQANKPNYSVKGTVIQGDLVEIGTLKYGDRYNDRYTVRKITDQGVHWVRDDGESGKWLGINEDLKFKVRKV